MMIIYKYIGNNQGLELIVFKKNCYPKLTYFNENVKKRMTFFAPQIVLVSTLYKYIYSNIICNKVI